MNNLKTSQAVDEPNAWMGGHPEAVAKKAYTTGPHPSLEVLMAHLREGDVAHGKTASGDLIFQGQMVDGDILPLDPDSARYLTSRTTLAASPRELPDGLGKAGAWLQLDKDEAAALYKALDGKPGLLGSIASKLKTCLNDVGQDDAFREAVQNKYAGQLSDGDLDFQMDAMVSRGDEGAYVMAFLWVSNAEAGLEDDIGDDDEDDLEEEEEGPTP